MTITATTTTPEDTHGGQGGIGMAQWSVDYDDDIGDATDQYAMASIDLWSRGKGIEPLRLRVEVKRTDSGAAAVIDGITVHGADVDPSISADDAVVANVATYDLISSTSDSFNLTNSDTTNWIDGITLTNGVPRYIVVSIDSPGEVLEVTITITAIYG